MTQNGHYPNYAIWRTKSSQFTFGGDIIVPFTFPTMACFLNISMARRVAGRSIADSGI